MIDLLKSFFNSVYFPIVVGSIYCLYFSRSVWKDVQKAQKEKAEAECDFGYDDSACDSDNCGGCSSCNKNVLIDIENKITIENVDYAEYMRREKKLYLYFNCYDDFSIETDEITAKQIMTELYSKSNDTVDLTSYKLVKVIEETDENE